MWVSFHPIEMAYSTNRIINLLLNLNGKHAVFLRAYAPGWRSDFRPMGRRFAP